MPAISVASEVLWHFTGGPFWNSRLARQNSSPKPTSAAYSALISILRSKQLRLGNYRESIKVKVKRRDPISDAKGKVSFGPARVIELSAQSRQVCCVADIPLGLLDQHSLRYGKFAVGFRRDSLVNAGFNPVLYTLEDRNIIQSFYSAVGTIRELDSELSAVASEIQEAESEASTLADDLGDNDLGSVASDVQGFAESADSNLDNVRDSLLDQRNQLETFMAFIKTFSESEFKTIFHEREWRSIEAYQFGYDDVAMVIVPRAGNHFENLWQALRRTLPRAVPVVPWEDIF